MRTLFRILHVIGAELATWPVLWGIAFLVPLLLIFLLVVRAVALPRLIIWESYLLRGAAIGLITAFAAMALLYLWSANFIDHVEPLVAVNSWLLWQGEPVYHLAESTQRQAIPYGPHLHIFIAAAQAAFGPSTFTSKLPAVLAALASLVLFYVTLARSTSRSRALVFTGLAAGLWLPFRHTVFWSRPEPFLLFAVTFALFAATRRGYLAAASVGAAAGVAIGLKTHGAFYFVPLAVLAARSGWSAGGWITAGATAVVTAFAPFLLPQLSLQSYVGAVAVAAGYSIGPSDLQAGLQWLVTIFAPAVILPLVARLTNTAGTHAPERDFWLYVGAIFASCLPVLLPASQTGAGPHHFIPFIPLLLFAAAELSHNGLTFRWSRNATGAIVQGVRYSWLISCLIVALWSTYAMTEQALRTQPRGVACTNDIRNLIAAHADKTLLMGVGGDGDYLPTFVRHELVFAGMPPGLDPITMMDFKGRNLPEPKLRALIDELRSRYGKPVIWLVPQGAPPFTMRTWYQPFDSLFSAEFRADFAALFERRESSEFFDVYAPRTNADGG